MTVPTSEPPVELVAFQPDFAATSQAFKPDIHAEFDYPPLIDATRMSLLQPDDIADLNRRYRNSHQLSFRGSNVIA